MKRKTALKHLAVFGALAASASSVYEFIRLNRKYDDKYLVSRKLLIAELCECIIPKTDTPGAKDAQVEDFVLHAVSNILSKKEQNNFVDGLRELEQTCIVRYDNTFKNCTEQEKLSVLKKMGGNRDYLGKSFIEKVSRKIQGRDFINILKSLTIIGYCTSRVGAEQGLAYVPIPVRFEACIPFLKDQKCWATK
ncbi:MAG: gluconate 2-dehydrogenase subunit 3 family protein [Niabella sp.]